MGVAGDPIFGFLHPDLPILCSKIWLGHETCEQGVVGDPIFGFLDPDLPILYITFVGLR